MEEETGVPDENPPSASSTWQTLSHNVVSSTPRHERNKKQSNIETYSKSEISSWSILNPPRVRNEGLYFKARLWDYLVRDQFLNAWKLIDISKEITATCLIVGYIKFH